MISWSRNFGTYARFSKKIFLSILVCIPTVRHVAYFGMKNHYTLSGGYSFVFWKKIGSDITHHHLDDLNGVFEIFKN